MVLEIRVLHTPDRQERLSYMRPARSLLAGDTTFVVGGAIEKRLDGPTEGELLAEVRDRIEVAAEPGSLSEVIVAKPFLDLEVGILLREIPEPLFNLTPFVFVGRTAFQVDQKAFDHTTKKISAPGAPFFTLCSGAFFLIGHWSPLFQAD